MDAMSISLIAVLVVFPAAMAYAAASDIVSMTIPNWLCLVLVATFTLCAFALGLSWSQLSWHFAAGFATLAICFGLFAAGWIGGGDAKLAAATALWLGFEQLLPYLLVASIAGGVLTVMLIILRRSPLPTVFERWTWAQRLHGVEKGVPYGIALAVGGLVVLPNTAIWRLVIGA
jgi:prepilin peptidase CpaA